MKTVHFEFNEKELLDFEKSCGISWKIKGRYSKLLLADLLAFYKLFNVGTDEVLTALRDYELGRASRTGNKPPTSFKHYPLKGLYHIHFSSVRYIKQNIMLGLGRNGLKNIIDEVFDNDNIDRSLFGKVIADRVVNKTLAHRASKNKMTGEWVVFAKHQGKLYYLCLARHKDGDQQIRNRIEEYCLEEFPFLKDLLCNNPAS